MSIDTLLLFAVTIFVISLTPGLCMTLAFTLGISVGFRKTLWMMLGELAGVATVALSVGLGVAQVLTVYPDAMVWLTFGGGAYLLYVAVSMWRTAEASSLNAEKSRSLSRSQLIAVGYNTAVLNPKGWAFLIAIFPGFIDDSLSLGLQLGILIPIFLVSEFISLCLYASGGRQLALWFSKPEHGVKLNRTAALMVFLVSVWFIWSGLS
jgi:homoserine/homoserine lactone efflux protein